jgi:phosphatidylglycerol---prolipoprotein diacylglyceryl transferase
LPWGVVFADGGNLPRHPSQLYESFFEGFVLFAILWLMRTRTTRDGQLLAAFIMLYGLFRFLIEFCREPDVQLGYYLSWMTMGQILCLLMMIGSGALLIYVNKFGGLVGQGGRPALNSKI